MKTRSGPIIPVIVWIFLVVGIAAAAQSRSTNSTTPESKETMPTLHAKGTFEVKIAPLAPENLPKGFARMSIDKQFHGDLEGTSVGEMLSTGSGGKGSSGGYVALEQVTGKLNGRSGSFVLQ